MNDNQLAARNPNSPVQFPNAVRTALFVYGDPQNSDQKEAKPRKKYELQKKADLRIKAQLQSLGFKVCDRLDRELQQGHANGHDLVFISATADCLKQNDQQSDQQSDHRPPKYPLRKTRVPIVLAQSFLYHPMGMTGPSEKDDFGVLPVESNELQIFPGEEIRDHLMAARLFPRALFLGESRQPPPRESEEGKAGEEEPERQQYFSFGRPDVGAIKIGYGNHDPEKVAIFGYERGQMMYDLYAPARRVGLFLASETALHLTRQGWELFDAAVLWATAGKAETFDCVFRQEWPEVIQRRIKQRYVAEMSATLKSQNQADSAEPLPSPSALPRNLVGLALSGGGIRSATFNLGLLQGFNERGWTRLFDYLSTVSGGGFIGAWWSAWLSRQNIPPQSAPANTSSLELEHPIFLDIEQPAAPETSPEISKEEKDEIEKNRVIKRFGFTAKRVKNADDFIRRLLPASKHTAPLPQSAAPMHKLGVRHTPKHGAQQMPKQAAPQQQSMHDTRDQLSRELWDAVSAGGLSQSNSTYDWQTLLEVFRAELKGDPLRKYLQIDKCRLLLAKAFKGRTTKEGKRLDDDETLKELLRDKKNDQLRLILDELRQVILDRLNDYVFDPETDLYSSEAFQNRQIALTGATHRLAQEAPEGERKHLLTRLLLEEAYPFELGRGFFPPREQIVPQQARLSYLEAAGDGSLNEEVASDLLSAGRDPIHHLRLFANYLTPRRGLLSSDTWRAVSVFSRNLLMTWFMLLPILIVLILLGQLYFIVHPNWGWKFFDAEACKHFSQRELLVGLARIALRPPGLLLAWALALVIPWLLVPEVDLWEMDAKRWWRFKRPQWWVGALRTVVVPLLVIAAIVPALPQPIDWPRKLLSPWFLVPLLGTLLVVVSGYCSTLSLTGRKQWKLTALRHRITMAHSRLLVTTTTLLLVLCVPVAGPLLVDYLLDHTDQAGDMFRRAGTAGVALAIAAALAGAIFTALKGAPSRSDQPRKRKPAARNRLIFAVTPLLVLIVLAFGFSWLTRRLIQIISQKPGIQKGMVLGACLGILFALFLVLAEIKWRSRWEFRLSLAFWGLLLVWWLAKTSELALCSECINGTADCREWTGWLCAQVNRLKQWRQISIPQVLQQATWFLAIFLAWWTGVMISLRFGMAKSVRAKKRSLQSAAGAGPTSQTSPSMRQRLIAMVAHKPVSIGILAISASCSLFYYEAGVHPPASDIPGKTFIVGAILVCLLITFLEMLDRQGDNVRARCLLAGVFVVLLIFLALKLLPAESNSESVRNAAFGLFGLLLSWIVVLGWTTDPNQLSMHLFYRARLTRAYLGASNVGRSENRKAITEIDVNDDLLMKDLENCARGGPYHIINTTLNLVGGSDLATTQRSAAVFALTKNYCGSSRTGYRDTREYMNGKLTLGSAVAISGAAASPSMGSLTPSAAQAMLLTLLNVRLGFWAPTPNKDYWRESQARLWPFLLLREFLSQTNDLASHCYLTDGAHFDNTGLYSLVERGCRYIVISDCGADPEMQFHDLGEAIRRCRIDFGAEIDLDLSPLLAHELGKSAEHFAIGLIQYSRRHFESLRHENTEEKFRKGIIILFKPVLTGSDEDADITQYGREDGRRFPHQATTDQWYDEAQFESYRRLGQITAHSLLDDLDKISELDGILKRLKNGEPILATDIETLFGRMLDKAKKNFPTKKKEGIGVDEVED